MQMSKNKVKTGLGNRLLGALEPASRQRIDAHLEPVSPKLGDIVCEPAACSNTPIFRKARCCRC